MDAVGRVRGGAAARTPAGHRRVPRDGGGHGGTVLTRAIVLTLAALTLAPSPRRLRAQMSNRHLRLRGACSQRADPCAPRARRTVPRRRSSGPGRARSGGSRATRRWRRACRARHSSSTPGLPPPRTKWTRRVPHPVLIGHAASFTPYRGLDEDKGSKLLLLNRALAALRLKNKQVTVVKLGEDTPIDSYESAIADCTRSPLLPTVSPPRESTLRDG